MAKPDLPAIEVIVSAISLLISFFALFVSVVFTRTARKRSSVEMSISLASDYQKMLDDMWVIREIVEKQQAIQEIIDKITPASDFDFTYDELSRYLTKAEIVLMEGFFETGKDLNVDIVRAYYDCEASVLHSGPNGCTPSDDALRHFFKRKFISALNKAEYISMAFAHEIAIDGVVYQSLHQSFFKYVKMFYFHIAFMNKKTTDHYYTNMITLYRNWKREDDTRNSDLKSVMRVKDIDQKNTEKSIKPNHTKRKPFTILL